MSLPTLELVEPWFDDEPTSAPVAIPDERPAPASFDPQLYGVGALLVLALVCAGYALAGTVTLASLVWFGVLVFVGGVVWPAWDGKRRAGGHSTAYYATRTCVHEAGHYGAGIALGGRCRAFVFPGGEGGFCQLLSGWFIDPIKNMAFLMAGGMACGSQTGCSADNAMIRGFANRFPADQRAAAYSRARALAASALARSAGLRSQVAAILKQTGRFG